MTHPPTAVTTFSSLFSPFDGPTWICLIVSLSTALAGIQLLPYFHAANLKTITKDVIGGFLNIFVLLFSQSCDGRMFRIGNAAPLVAGWLFICFILMNNLYGGEIFASLTVTPPPNVPRTIHELAESKLQIFTGSWHAFPNARSNLHDSIIPQLNPAFKNNTKFLNLLSKLSKKIVFANKNNLNFTKLKSGIHSNSTNRLFNFI